ncbi:hypothetical protein [Streptomyces sp. NPDC000931]|uniref:SbtR family transcriptional regulator n=1 Tax=Streptomyces sp. NPDC000931 TaxID=3154372 RepID=UPI0033296463
MGSHHGSGLTASLHRGPRVVQAQEQLHSMIEELLADGARQGSVRGDIAPGELASYCLHALAAAGDLPSQAAVHRLVAVTLAGVHPAATPAAKPALRTDTAARPGHRSGHQPAPGSHRHE